MNMQFNALSNFNSAVNGKKSAAPTIESVKKLGCKADGDNAYVCDIELTIDAEGKKNAKSIPMRLVKTSSGWQASK